MPLTARSSNLNAVSDCRVKSVKDDCLSRLILFCETSLGRGLREYGEGFIQERGHLKNLFQVIIPNYVHMFQRDQIVTTPVNSCPLLSISGNLARDLCA